MKHIMRLLGFIICLAGVFLYAGDLSDEWQNKLDENRKVLIDLNEQLAAVQSEINLRVSQDEWRQIREGKLVAEVKSAPKKAKLEQFFRHEIQEYLSAQEAVLILCWLL